MTSKPTNAYRPPESISWSGTRTFISTVFSSNPAIKNWVGSILIQSVADRRVCQAKITTKEAICTVWGDMLDTVMDWLAEAPWDKFTSTMDGEINTPTSSARTNGAG